jgi:death-on-curing protein
MPSCLNGSAVAEAPLFDYLSEEDLYEIAGEVVGSDVVVSDPGLLVSAATRPLLRVLGGDAYPSFVDQAAALMQSLARNHALINGNLRLAWAATRVFCLLNGRDWNLGIDEAERTVRALTSGELDAGSLADVLRERIR